jgi:hypothetical protein
MWPMIAISTITTPGAAMTGDDPLILVRSDFDTFVRSTYPGLTGVEAAKARGAAVSAEETVSFALDLLEPVTGSSETT